MTEFVIFDLDGTLLNTLDDLANAANHVLARHGFPTHAPDAYKLFVGNGIYKLMERCIPREYSADPALIAALRDEFNAYYALHNLEKTAPYPDIPELLSALRTRGVRLAVLSNKPHPFTQALCAKLFPGVFEFAYGQREGFPTKPDKSLTAELLQLAGVSREKCMYVGDSGVDMQTAKNGGLFAAGALWGFRSAEELLENGADALLRYPMDFLAYFENKS